MIVVTVVIVVFESAERAGDVCRDTPRVGAVARVERATRAVAEPVTQINRDGDVRVRCIDRYRRRERRLDPGVDGAREDECLPIEGAFDPNAQVLELRV